MILVETLQKKNYGFQYFFLTATYQRTAPTSTDRRETDLNIIFYIKRCFGCRQFFCNIKICFEIRITRIQHLYLLECNNALGTPAHAAERVRLVEPCVGIVWFDTDGRVEGVQLLVVIPIRGDLVVELVLIVMTDIVEDLSVVYPGCSG